MRARASTRPHEGHHSAGPPASPARRWSHRHFLAFVLGLTAATDLLFYTGYYASDDMQYLRGACQLAQSGALSSVTLGTMRVSLLLPLVALIKLIGFNLFALTASFVLYHLVLVAGTYWLGSLVHGMATGAVAAGMVGICPLCAAFATTILPDHPMTALVVLTAALLTSAGWQSMQSQALRRGPAALTGLAGVSFGLACVTKVTAVIMAPCFVIPMLFWLRKRPVGTVLKALLLFCAGTVLAGAVMWLVFYQASGLVSPLQDEHVAELLASSADSAVERGLMDSQARLEKLLTLASADAYLGIFTWALPLSLVLYPILRGRVWGLYGTFVWLTAYLTWGTISFTRYAPPPMQIRYYILPLPFGMIMVAYVFVGAGSWLWARASVKRRGRILLLVLGALAGLLAVVHSYTGLNRLAGRMYWAPEVNGTRYALDYLGQLGGRRVLLSYWLSARTWPLFQAKEYPGVITSGPTTTRAEMSKQLDEGLLYVDCAYEQVPNRRYPQDPSPLDYAIQEALAGRNETLAVRTVAAFGQFKTRLSALGYVFGGSSHYMDLRSRERQVFVREVKALHPEAKPLDDRIASVMDLTQPSLWDPSWVYRVETCDVRITEQGALACSIAGSDEESGGQYGGVRLQVGHVRAVQLEVTFENADQIAAVYLDLTAGPGTKERLRWEGALPPSSGVQRERQRYTFRPGYSTGAFFYVGGPGPADQIDHAHFFIRLKGRNARAGFRIHRVLVERG